MASLEGNKIVAALLTGGVAAWTAAFLGELMFPHPHIEAAAYPIVASEASDETTETVAEAAPSLEPIGPLLASADADAGQKVARKCSACHSFDQGGPNKVGPNLWQIVGHPIGQKDGYSYSDALEALSDQAWTYEELNAFLANPKGYAPGTKMAYAGLKKPGERADLIAYLRSLSESPEPLPQ